MTQNWWVAAICPELKSTALWRRLTSLAAVVAVHPRGSQPAGGALRNSEAKTTTAPWMIPHWMNAVW